MNQNQRQYLQSAVQVLKEHGMGVNVKNISHFVNGVIPENIIQEWIEAEQEMQALDVKLSYADKDIIVEGDSKEFCEES